MNTYSSSRSAQYTGWSIVSMAILAGFAYGGVLQHYSPQADAQKTAQDIADHLVLFGLALACMVGVMICDLVVTLHVFRYFRPVNANLSIVMAALRLVYTIFLAASLLQLWQILSLLQRGVEIHSIAVEVQQHLYNFSQIWAYGLIAFGVHLLLLGLLSYQSGFVPRIWCILLPIAGVCYILTSGGQVMIERYHEYKTQLETVLALPMAVAELGFGIWLLVKGRKIVYQNPNTQL